MTRLLLSIVIDFKIIPTAIKRYERFIEGLMLESCYFITPNNLSAVINQTEEKKREYLKSFNARQKLFLSIAIESKIIRLYAVN